jgi:hypothetical protein
VGLPCAMMRDPPDGLDVWLIVLVHAFSLLTDIVQVKECLSGQVRLSNTCYSISSTHTKAEHFWDLG